MTPTYTAPLSEASEAARIAVLPQQVQWLIQDIAARYEAIIDDKDSEIEGLEEAEMEAQSEADSAFNELESVRNDLNAAENALENLETEILDNARACFEALKFHSGLPADFPELVALGHALNGDES